ncbi:MAG: hypothetical protein DCC67_06170 [Planctomycetota bacterium]|nr:MAG: hypothetical protein DCC67_06170 [Planctomycetota bacterium]
MPRASLLSMSRQPRAKAFRGPRPMAHCLIGLGSNLGDRPDHLRRAMLALARLPATRLLARSRFHETAPLGGPAGQGRFLNAAAVAETSLEPVRWAARPLDLDLLLYGRQVVETPSLAAPHPRMTYRRFVLQPAVEIAAGMLHAESQWTVGRLLNHLDAARDAVAVAARDGRDAAALVEGLAERFGLGVRPAAAATSRPTLCRWEGERGAASFAVGSGRPKLLLAVRSSAGISFRHLRTMLHLPPHGPIGWIGCDAAIDPLDEACAAIESVWPELTRKPS